MNHAQPAVVIHWQPNRRLMDSRPCVFKGSSDVHRAVRIRQNNILHTQLL